MAKTKYTDTITTFLARLSVDPALAKKYLKCKDADELETFLTGLKQLSRKNINILKTVFKKNSKKLDKAIRAEHKGPVRASFQGHRLVSFSAALNPPKK
jgi:hypothetical protein